MSLTCNKSVTSLRKCTIAFARCVFEVEQYYVTIRHIKGTSNYMADVLSRNPAWISAPEFKGLIRSTDISMPYNLTKTLFLLQPTQAQIYITIFCLYIMFTPTCFDTFMSSSGIFKTCTSLSYVISWT